MGKPELKTPLGRLWHKWKRVNTIK